MDLVCGDDDGRVLVGGGWGREAGVGGRGVQGVAHRLHQAKLAVASHLVAQSVHHHPCPRGLVQRRAGGAEKNDKQEENRKEKST